MLVIFTVALLMPSFARCESKDLVFLETMPNPDGTDGPENEYFTLFNQKDSDVDLTGYKICNLINDCYEPKNTIPSGGCLKIFRKDFNFTLHNDKEELSLIDKDNQIIDKVITGSAPSGKAWVCQSDGCKFDNPSTDCKYVAEIPPAEVIPEKIPEKTDEIPISSPQEETSATSKSVVPKNSSEKTSEKTFEISSSNDFDKALEKIKEGLLASLLINIKGRIAIPKEVFSPTIFYLSSYGKLVKISVYSSALSNTDFSSDESVEIQNGYLKYQSQAFVIGIGKKTKIGKINKNLLSKSSKSKTTPFSLKKAKQLEGKNVKLEGEILEKKGDYFFLKNTKNSENVTVYFPKPLWMKYQGTKEAGKAFPVYFKDPSKTSDFKGSLMNLKGVVEYKEGSSRIIVRDLKEIAIQKKSLISEEKAKEKIAKKTDNTNKNSPEAKISQPNQLTPAVLTSITNPNPKNTTITFTDLAQRISWKTIWQLTWRKVVNWIGKWF